MSSLANFLIIQMISQLQQENGSLNTSDVANGNVIECSSDELDGLLQDFEGNELNLKFATTANTDSSKLDMIDLQRQVVYLQVSRTC